MMIAVTPRCDGCQRRNEECIPSSATRGDRSKCEACRLRRVACITSSSVTPRSSNTNTERGRRTENDLTVRRPGVDYDIELIRGDFTMFAPYRRYTTRSPVPPPPYDEPDPIVLVENPENRVTTPPTRDIPPTRRPPSYDQFERERVANEEAARRNEQERKKKEEEEAKKKKKKKKRRRNEKRKKEKL
ncbi:hypothetical protein H4Q26_014374 [Puccinia striiformis f. sp. tritici PST-130]|nr:hypothetical protein H4Q26_014374 [Puccinia striiformis f. sp. tritici PST-130]